MYNYGNNSGAIWNDKLAQFLLDKKLKKQYTNLSSCGLYQIQI